MKGHCQIDKVTWLIKISRCHEVCHLIQAMKNQFLPYAKNEAKVYTPFK